METNVTTLYKWFQLHFAKQKPFSHVILYFHLFLPTITSDKLHYPQCFGPPPHDADTPLTVIGCSLQEFTPLIRRVEGDNCCSLCAAFHRDNDVQCALQYTHTSVQASGEFELNISTSIAELCRETHGTCSSLTAGLFHYLPFKILRFHFMNCRSWVFVDINAITSSDVSGHPILWICLCRHINTCVGPTAHDLL